MAKQQWRLQNKLGCIGMAGIALALLLPVLLDMPWWSLALVIAGIATPVFAWKRSRLKSRRRNPKGYGYDVYEEFGPQRATPRAERLAEIFPKLPASEIDEWISDYKQVESFVWTLAEAGGSSVLGKEQVRTFFLQAFPWLDGPGLITATGRVDYYSWHDGYPSAPIKTLAEVIERVELLKNNLTTVGA